MREEFGIETTEEEGHQFARSLIAVFAALTKTGRRRDLAADGENTTDP